ncbi:LuxR C-terminal-related transcriptional regulator [Paenibacillus kobensis]|uniref:LuxR C-terminal-related transcriptional regulator n=1 Tax=Paenibacillus kobensis TaxID=59841 RepID=UPI0027D79DCE|nr:LuxR C-terminal-related transcriptional regulator [Paenibacillus kobensis]
MTAFNRLPYNGDMTIPIVSTKLYIPPSRPKVVARPHLIQRLNEGLHRKLTLVSAATGFGKTTLVSEWLAGINRPAAWLSLDEGDNDAVRFLTGLLAALQSIGVDLSEGIFDVLRGSHSPPVESIVTAILHPIIAYPNDFILVLDDCHVIEDNLINRALAMLIERMPPSMHLVMTTRHDPRLPLPLLRVRDQLTELRSDDLRFTLSETTGFLNGVMGLRLAPHNIELLEERTEGWIAGLQLAALSLQGHQDAAGFIQSFTGSHRFVLDYLMEEVLRKQPVSVQSFLLHTSVLDRLCGPLCSAVAGDADTAAGSETLAYLERANLFLVPLDHERQWYRYHHLFAELLRQRAAQADSGIHTAELHSRASRWYEDNGLEVEAFLHAASAGDIDRAARLMEGRGLPLHFRGVINPVLHWLHSLSEDELESRPSLCVMSASVLLMAGQVARVQQLLHTAEAVLDEIHSPDEDMKDLIGHIAAIRATIAVSEQRPETIIAQSQRALEYLRPTNLPVRTSTIWTLGCAYELQGDRASAGRAYTEAASISKRIGHTLIQVLSMIGLGSVQETDNQLVLAVDTYRKVLELAGEPPIPVACEAHLGLARIYYEWNDMERAEHHGQLSLQLSRQLDRSDRFVASELFLARLALARGQLAETVALLAKSEHFIKQHQFVNRLQDWAAVQVLALLHQGDIAAASAMAEGHDLPPMSKAKLRLVQGDAEAALALLDLLGEQAEKKGWADIRLRATVLQSLAHSQLKSNGPALQLLREALTLGHGSFVRTFTEEGEPMAALLREAISSGIMPEYAGRLLASMNSGQAEVQPANSGQLRSSGAPIGQPLIDPLSERELEVLRLIAEGLSNHEIGERLFLALSTVKGYIRTIFDKLQVKRRTEAVARARQLGLL